MATSPGRACPGGPTVDADLRPKRWRSERARAPTGRPIPRRPWQGPSRDWTALMSCPAPVRPGRPSLEPERREPIMKGSHESQHNGSVLTGWVQRVGNALPTGLHLVSLKRDAVWTAADTFASAGLAFGFRLLVARALSPEEFGLAAV